jgi:hypothetical protein
LLTKEEIEEVLSRHPWLRPPKYIYILSAPVVSPELRAFIYGLNPVFQRDTVILSSTATEETLIHETLHVNLMGERAAYTLAPRLLRFRASFPPVRSRRPVYRVEEISSRELESYGLKPYVWADGYRPAELKVVKLELVGFRRVSS